MKKRLSFNKERKKTKMIVVTLIVLVVAVACGIGSYQITSKKIFLNSDKTTQQTKVATSTDSPDGTQDTDYLPLDKDPNAEDATVVAANTEGIITGTKKYPVRTDGKKVVYLTLDDGPSSETTQQNLDTLDKFNVKATFFVTGIGINKENGNADLLKEIAQKGHAIGNHTYSHNYKILYPNRTIDANAFMTDVDKCNETLKSVLGSNFSTRVLRFPGGYWSWKGREAIKPILDQRGYAIINWNSLSEDAQGKQKNAQELLERVKFNTENLGPNVDSVVVLMHDTYGKEESVKALPSIIEYFKSKGFEFKTIK